MYNRVPKFENVEQTLWKNMFCSPFDITTETKLQSFNIEYYIEQLIVEKNYMISN